MSTPTLPAPGKYLSAGLWAAQTLVALVFIAAGLTKLLTPIAQLAAMMAWTGEYPLAFVRGIGMVDIAGGLGILLPSLTRILPRLTVLAALCSVVLQVLAIGFHASRGEFEALPLNFVLLPLCLFVLWGRATRAPIGPRGAARPQPG